MPKMSPCTVCKREQKQKQEEMYGVGAGEEKKRVGVVLGVLGVRVKS